MMLGTARSGTWSVTVDGTGAVWGLVSRAMRRVIWISCMLWASPPYRRCLAWPERKSSSLRSFRRELVVVVFQRHAADGGEDTGMDVGGML